MAGSLPTLSDSAYRIESKLGSGGGGVVYKAWHTRLQKYVVLKELRRGSENDIETQRNEVEALKNVKSTYLPQVFDFLGEGGRIFTVMEFVKERALTSSLNADRNSRSSRSSNGMGSSRRPWKRSISRTSATAISSRRT